MNSRTLRLAAIASVLETLAACGGGGGGSGAPAAGDITISGTVAIGAPLVGTKVQVLTAALPGGSGAAAFATTTDFAGNYRVTLPAGSKPPFMVRAGGFASDTHPIYPRLYSLSMRSGMVNVTPLTDLLFTRLVNKKQQDFWGNFDDIANMSPTDQQIAAATRDVMAYLLTRPDKNNGNNTAPVDVAAVTDFVSMPFTPSAGDPYDNALVRLDQSLMDGENITGIEEHMLFAGAPAASLASIFPLDFDATCSPFSTGPGVPAGATHIRLSATGIAIGSYAYTFRTGDGIFISTGTVVDKLWRFTLSGTVGDQVELNMQQGMLFSLTLLTGSFESICKPTASVPLSDKWPGILALDRLLRDSTMPRDFTCAASTAFPGVMDGTNTLVFDANGALRVQPGGYALHLPSFDFNVNADVVVDAGGFRTMLRSVNASWAYRTQFDVFEIQLTTAGIITSVRFSKNRGVTLSKSC